MPKHKIEIKLTDLLEKKHLTQSELSKKTGIRPATISELARGSRTVFNIEQIEKISDALELQELSEIISFKEDHI